LDLLDFPVLLEKLVHLDLQDQKEEQESKEQLVLVELRDQ